MRSLAKLVLIGVLLSAISPVMALGAVYFSIGQRTVDDDFQPVEDQDSLGLTLLLKEETWPLAILLGVHTSDATGSDIIDFESDMFELSIGVAKLWDKFWRVRPYVGGGITVLDAEFRMNPGGSSIADHDKTVAPYLNGGVLLRLGEKFNVGLDVRAVTAAEVNLFQIDADADYTQVSLMFGSGW